MNYFHSYSEFLNEAKMSPKYFASLLDNFDMYTKVKSINGWTLNDSSLEKDRELVWQKDNMTLYTYLFSDQKEVVEFELYDNYSTGSTIDLKKIVGSITLPQKYTENYLLDIENYIKNVDRFTKKLNKVLR